MRRFRKAATLTGTMREIRDEARSEYGAARPSPLKREPRDLPSGGAGADYHLRNDRDYYKMGELARYLERDDPHFAPFLQRVVDNVLGPVGMTLDADTGDDNLDLELEARWASWSNDPDQCDVTGENTFAGLCHLAAKSVDRDGDILQIPTSAGKIELIENHRVRTPTRSKKPSIVLGVELDGSRKHRAYWVTKEDIDPMRAVTVWKELTSIPAYNADGTRAAWLLKDINRVTQTRGVSKFSPLLEYLGMIGDTQFATLVKQQMSAFWALMTKSTPGFNPMNDGGTPIGEQSETQSPSGENRILENVAPGMILEPPAGKEYEAFAPNIPGSDYLDHIRNLLQIICANLGIPLQLFLLDGSETNFTGWRGAMDQARIGFKRRQDYWANIQYQRIYAWQLRRWIASDPVLRSMAGRSDVKINKHRWQPPKYPYIQPMDDAGADILRMRNGLAPPSQVHAENGGEWKRNTIQSISDVSFRVRRAMETANQINAEQESAGSEFRVDWRELMHLPTPDGIQMAIPVNDPNKQAKPDDKPKEPPNGRNA